MAAAGTGGLERRGRRRERSDGEMRYTRDASGGLERQGAPRRTWTTDHIDLAVLYPTMLLGLQSETDVDFAEAQAAPTTTGAPTTCRRARGGCSAQARCRRCTNPTTSQRVAAEIRRVAELPGMVSVFMRPNPAVDWRPFNDPVYDPIWQAAADTGLPIALHPFLAPDLPGACVGLRLARPRHADGSYAADFDRTESTTDERLAIRSMRPNMLLHPGDRATRST